MRVFVSDALRNYFSAQSSQDLIEAFKWWKEDVGREFKSPFFGKDSGLIRPKVDGRDYALRHCHLIPLNDERALSRWKADFRRESRKTSDRVLIYAQDDEDYYLIDVVDDPGAHQIMRMVDSQGYSFMARCAREASSFLSGQLVLESA